MATVNSNRDVERTAGLTARLGANAQATGLDNSRMLPRSAPFYRWSASCSTARTHHTGSATKYWSQQSRRTPIYLEICDAREPPAEMFRVDRTTRAAGATGGLGMGARTGTLLAMFCMNAHDVVERAYIAKLIVGPDPPYPCEEGEPNAASERLIHYCAEPDKIRRGGELADSRALDEIELSYHRISDDSAWLRGRSGELDVLSFAESITPKPSVNCPAASAATIHGDLVSVAERAEDACIPVSVTSTLIRPSAKTGEVGRYLVEVAALMLWQRQLSSLGMHGQRSRPRHLF
ncbi:hypothetical protein [Saccharopolyspora tripterygii]